MSAKKSLGRGFDILMPKDIDITLLEEDQNRVQKLLISDILPNQDQPRSNFDDRAHKELAQSIKRHGVIQPIIVVRHGQQYRIVAGERRWRAAQAANLIHIPAIIRSLKELEQLEIALIENIQRVDLSPLEQALAIYKLQQHFSLALDDIAQKLGKATSTVSNLTRLLQLPEQARAALAERRISEGHARAILALVGKPTVQQELLNLIITNNWTVRQAEQFVVAAKKGLKTKSAISHTDTQNPVTEELSKKLKMPVNIRRTAKGGQLIISFKTDKELNKITKLLS